MAFMITNESTGNEFWFRSEAEYEAAEAWHNKTSKHALIDFYVAHDPEPIGAIWEDENCTSLAADWHDVVMEKYARIISA
jgi:hypothetical protein